MLSAILQRLNERVVGPAEADVPRLGEQTVDVCQCVVTGHDLVLFLDASLVLLVARAGITEALTDRRVFLRRGHLAIDEIAVPVVRRLALVGAKVADIRLRILGQHDAVEIRHPVLARRGLRLEVVGVATITGDAVLDDPLVVPTEEGVVDLRDLLDFDLLPKDRSKGPLLETMFVRDGDELNTELSLLGHGGGDEGGDVRDSDVVEVHVYVEVRGELDAHGVSPEVGGCLIGKKELPSLRRGRACWTRDRSPSP